MSTQAQQIEGLINTYQKQQKGTSLDYKIVETIEDNHYTRVFAQQTIEGIPVYNSYTTYIIKDNKIVSDQSSMRNYSSSAKKSQPTLSFEDIFQKIAHKEGLSVFMKEPEVYTNQKGIFNNSASGNNLVYYIDAQQNPHLAYSITFRKANAELNEIFDAVVDAQSGEILEIHSQTLSCGFSHGSFSNENSANFKKEDWQWLYDDLATTTSSTASYNVFALPLESPNHGPRRLVSSNEVHPLASPLGWHHDGTSSTTMTLGNNVKAVNDHQSIGYNSNGRNISDYVDGGSNLNFDFPINSNLHPYENKNAVTTNLFYMNNVMHDIFYMYGFDEKNGNFQTTNHNKGGAGNDAVVALAQTGLSIDKKNNATFGTPRDGSFPIMSMYLWDPAIYPLTIHSPSNLARIYAATLGSFSAPLPTDALKADLILAKKAETTGTPYDGCGTISNSGELNGKIAVIVRGECGFAIKVKNVQNAGAKAAVIINNQAGELLMGGEDKTINIPAFALNQEDGNPIIAALKNTTVNGSIQAKESVLLDGSLDNGIIAHEYGHGISNRLTGGPNISGCLSNKEQMGEGWSDFFGLMITQLPGDVATTRRGVGSYASDQKTTGPGIRPTVYTTDMSVNPSTYGYLKNYKPEDSPHDTGYVWASMLWDLNWKMIEKYNFSPDMYGGNAGNNLALQLVVDGLKLQKCSPGFIDGRNAILKADEINNNSENQCDIWSVFARRGLGYSADQGSSNIRDDAKEAFDMPPSCLLSTQSVTKNNNLQLYPNPAKDIVHIVDKTIKGEVKIEILDLTGRLVSSETINFNNDRTSISTQHLSSGIYIVKFHLTDGVVTKKIIKK